MHIKISVEKLFKYLLGIITFLVTMNLLGIYSKYWLGHGNLKGMIQFFHLNRENNLPTFYSALAIILCSLLLYVVSLSKKSIEKLQWQGLSAIFLFLSLDEALQIHDRLDLPLRALLGTSGVLRHAWIIPYLSLFIGGAILYRKFLFDLEKDTRKLFVISGIIFLSGAIGFEIISGLVSESIGWDNATYSFVYTIEETLEMFGIALFAYSILRHIKKYIGSIQLDFER